MFERFNLALRLTSAALAALVIWQVAHLLVGKNPVGQLTVSSNVLVPAAASEPKASSADTNSPAKKGAAANLPPAIQARLDKITQSEILGAVVKPLPMALLGIAGQDAFIRAPN